MTLKINITDSDFDRKFRKFLNERGRPLIDVSHEVIPLIEDVRENGDEALVRLNKRFDNYDSSTSNLRVTDEEISEALKVCSNGQLQSLKLAIQRIKRYHKKQLPKDVDYLDKNGIRLGWRWTPINSVGVYVPGGTASYPSSVLMNAIPAKIAGVGRVVITTPVSDGKIMPLVLAAARAVGVDEIYKVGGAQALAALAYGTKSINSVDKIVGPGNIYVAAAKKLLFGQVGIDMVAGPSEILVLADNKNDPELIAVDLLSQAEHDKNAQAMLITDSEEFAESILIKINMLLKRLSRREIASVSWQDFGAIIVVEDLQQSIQLINSIAPEHLQLSIESPESFLTKIVNAGAIFLGRNTPEALGDYIAGPNHVLPTNGSARFASGLGTLDFMKRSSVIGVTKKGLKEIGPAAVELANAEGLEAHSLSISKRLGIK